MKLKISTISISILLVGLLAYGFISMNSNDPYTDYAPGVETSITTGNGTQSDTIPPASWTYPQVWNFYYGNVALVNGGTVGACFFKGHYWFNAWNSTSLYWYDPVGPNGGPGGTYTTKTYQGTVRDMAISPPTSPQGHFIWGGAASTTLYKFDSSGATVGTFAIPGASFRATAYDPVRDGFWNANFGGNITCYSTTGTLLATFVTTTTGKYGMAYDDKSVQDSAILWVWDQVPANTLHRVNVTGTPTLTGSYLFTSGIMIAGGAEAYPSPDGTEYWITLNFQNNANVAYKLADLGPGATPQYYNWENVGTSSNTFPFGQAAGKAVNYLFLPNSFVNPTPVPTGQAITDVYFFITTGGTRTFTNFEILMAQTTDTDLTTGTFYAGPWDTVYTSASLPQTWSSTSWSTPITLDHPFPYDPAKSLVIFVGQCGGAGTGMYVRNNTAPGGIKRTWSVGGCPFMPYAGGDASTINFGFNVTPYSGITPVSNTPDKFSLSQNYPNPFNPTTTINYSIIKSGLVTLKVYNVLGKEVASLVNEVKNAGSYAVNFDGSELTSGTYFYRIEAGDFTDVKKMILLK